MRKNNRRHELYAYKTSGVSGATKQTIEVEASGGIFAGKKARVITMPSSLEGLFPDLGDQVTQANITK